MADDWIALTHHIIRKDFRWAREKGVEYDALLSAGWEGIHAAEVAKERSNLTGPENRTSFYARSIKWSIHHYLESEFHFRRHIRPDFVELTDVISEHAPSNEDVEDVLLTLEVERLLSCLCVRHRELVERHFFHDETLEQIGRGWGTNLKAASKVKIRALEVLRKHCECG